MYFFFPLKCNMNYMCSKIPRGFLFLITFLPPQNLKFLMSTVTTMTSYLQITTSPKVSNYVHASVLLILSFSWPG